jgi:HTH-type transcriptional regulator, competence development regulator
MYESSPDLEALGRALLSGKGWPDGTPDPEREDRPADQGTDPVRDEELEQRNLLLGPLCSLSLYKMLNLSSDHAERLTHQAWASILRAVTKARTKARPKRSPRGQKALGDLLADLRAAKRLSLRQVEEATDRAVSNAYLSQLEMGRIQRPSPNVFQQLAAVYAVPYETLMEKAGYLPPSAASGVVRRTPLSAFAIDDLTAEEEEELLKYLAFIRSRDPSP